MRKSSCSDPVVNHLLIEYLHSKSDIWPNKPFNQLFWSILVAFIFAGSGAASSCYEIGLCPRSFPVSCYPQSLIPLTSPVPIPHSLTPTSSLFPPSHSTESVSPPDIAYIMATPCNKRNQNHGETGRKSERYSKKCSFYCSAIS